MLYLIEPHSFLANEYLRTKSANKPASQQHRCHLKESDTAFEAGMDVPGVKVEDVSITLHNNGSLLVTTKDNKFSKAIPMNTKSVATEKIEASLHHGVLTIKIPKREPVTIPVSTSDESSASEPDESFNTVSFTMDVPGVKVEDVTVTLEENSYLRVHATRTFGNKKRTLTKTFSVDVDDIEVKSITARLAHGVLYIQANRRPQPAPQEVTVQVKETATAGTDKDDQFHFSMDIPGVKASDVSVKIVDDMLQIEAVRTTEYKKLRQRREVSLDARVQRDAMQAELVNGVLTVYAPRAPQPDPRVIAITNGEVAKTSGEPDEATA